MLYVPVYILELVSHHKVGIRQRFLEDQRSGYHSHGHSPGLTFAVIGLAEHGCHLVAPPAAVRVRLGETVGGPFNSVFEALGKRIDSRRGSGCSLDEDCEVPDVSREPSGGG